MKLWAGLERRLGALILPRIQGSNVLRRNQTPNPGDSRHVRKRVRPMVYNPWVFSRPIGPRWIRPMLSMWWRSRCHHQRARNLFTGPRCEAICGKRIQLGPRRYVWRRTRKPLCVGWMRWWLRMRGLVPWLIVWIGLILHRWMPREWWMGVRIVLRIVVHPATKGFYSLEGLPSKWIDPTAAIKRHSKTPNQL